MKNIVFFILILSTFSCDNEKREKEILKNFIQDVFLEKNKDNISQFMHEAYSSDFNKLNKEEQQAHLEYINFFIDDINKKLINTSYSIVTTQDLKAKVAYKGKGKAYFLINGDEDLLTLFIVKNGKLLSFCPDIYSTKNETIVPYYFFDEFSIK